MWCKGEAIRLVFCRILLLFSDIKILTYHCAVLLGLEVNEGVKMAKDKAYAS